ncbi:WD40 repeat-containing protein [Nocardia nova SH22a]|uniref:WD40 repeat-containing protein n=2 Tax=Nocardia nova TaxID=37330 RepID=W5T8W5_9NOCA|nr:WD40 repeat-containing protein [Nocardia nova SH22a]
MYYRADAASRRALEVRGEALAEKLGQDIQLRGFASDVAADGERRTTSEALAAHALSPTTSNMPLIAAGYRTRGAVRVLPSYGTTTNYAVDPGGRWAAIGSGDGRVDLVDLSTGSAPESLPPGDGTDYEALAVNGNGRWVVSGNSSGTVLLWDSHSHQAPEKFPDPDHAWALAVAVTSDGRWVAVADYNGRVRVWDTRTSVVHDVSAEFGQFDAGFTLSADGRWLVTLGQDSHLRQWDLWTEAPPRNLGGPEIHAGARPVASPDGRWVVAATSEGRMGLWDTRSDAPPRLYPVTLPGPSAVSADGRWVAWCDNGSVMLWDSLGDGAARTRIAPPDTSCQGVTIDPETDRVTTVDRVGRVAKWDFDHPSDAHRLPDVASLGANPILVSDGGDRVVSQTSDGRIGMWNAHSDALPRTVDRDTSFADVALSSDGRWLVSAYDEVRVLDLDGTVPVRTMPGTQPLSNVAIDGDDGRVIAGDENGRVHLWDTHSPAPPRLLSMPGEIRATAISADGRWVAAAQNSGAVQIWDTADAAAPPRTMPFSGPDSVVLLRISPDGRWVVGRGKTSGLRLWDTRTQAPPRILRAPDTDAMIVNMAISPDGRWVAGSTSKGVLLWSTDSRQEGVAWPLQLWGLADGLAFGTGSDSITVVSDEGEAVVQPLIRDADPDALCAALGGGITDEEWRGWVSLSVRPVDICPH